MGEVDASSGHKMREPRHTLVLVAKDTGADSRKCSQKPSLLRHYDAEEATGEVPLTGVIGTPPLGLSAGC